ncbi:MAG: FAA hydrolase family protein, partial [Woeseia sp.]
MKLGTLKAGGRDGSLIVVSRDLTRAIRVPDIAATLQAALDDWDAASMALGKVAASLEVGAVEGEFAFDPAAVG